MNNVNFNNKDFQRMIKHIRKALPYLATFLLIGVYVVSAAAGGVFLSQLMNTVPGGITLAYAIGVAIQATRATLVFFPQLNPTRPSFSLAGEVIAVSMGVISITEIIFLVIENGLAAPVAGSLSVLMLAGVGVELFLLREIKFATEIELFGDESHWNNLQSFYQARKEFKVRLDQLKDIEFEPTTAQLAASATNAILSNVTPQRNEQEPPKQEELQRRNIGFEMPQRNAQQMPQRNDYNGANTVSNGVSDDAYLLEAELQRARNNLRAYESKLRNKNGNPETLRRGVAKWSEKVAELEQQLQQIS